MSAPRRSALILFAISGGLLLGALGFQYIGGMAPCEMCFWQRYAHLAVIAVALAAIALASRPLGYVAVFTMLVSAGLGFFHAGVEQGWWTGPTACASAMRPGMSTDDILSTILTSPLVRCDQIPWQFLGLSMAAWNALISLLAAAMAAFVLRRR